MRLTEKYPAGYYWARHSDGTTFVVLQEGGQFFMCGLHDAIGDEFRPEAQIIMPVPRPVH